MLAVALSAASFVPAALLQGDYRTLPANMDLTIEIPGQNVPGIEGRQRITTDAKGFRTCNRLVRYDDETPFRIFAIGASTTEQAFLDESRTWTRLLERSLNDTAGAPVEVINTGVAGLRLTHHLASQERIEALGPDLVLFLIGVNDWNRQVTAHFDRDERFRKTWLARMRGLFERSIAFTFHQLYVALPQQSNLVVQEAQFTAMTDRARRPYIVAFSPPAVSEGFAAAMARLAERCREGAYECMLLTQPAAYYLGAPDSVTRNFRLTPPGRSYTLDLQSLVHMEMLYNDFQRDLAAAHDLGLCDLAAGVPKGTDAFYDDVHFNTNGARIVSELVSDCIVEQGFAP